MPILKKKKPIIKKEIIVPKNKDRRLPFSPLELQKITQADDLAKLFYYTGIRRFELSSLLKNYEASESDAVKIWGKGNKFRIVPLNKAKRELIEKLRKEWSDASTKIINNHFQKLSITLNIKKITPHRFRSTFATNLIENGVDLVTIQTLMGHSKIQTTAEYIKISTINLKGATDLLSDPKLNLDGMNVFEMRSEIIRLRKRLNLHVRNYNPA